ncbi:MAG TPA: DUF2769 domain-containing protein [Methanospirillum sp.]|nr:DUF2769 domain-containing protein [Methanospirillum sp.]
MDNFEKIVKEMKKLPLAEQEKLLEEKKKLCICPSCPSFNKCAIVEREKLFCMIGKSFLCISYEEGCNCPDCPISKEAGLQYKYFCTRGDEKGQRYENVAWGSTLSE